MIEQSVQSVRKQDIVNCINHVIKLVRSTSTTTDDE